MPVHLNLQPKSILSAVFALLLFALPFASASADQGDRRQQARQLVELGQTAFQEERFDEAAIYFQEAYNLDPHPNLMFNIARAHEEMGDYPAALRFYEQVLTFDPGERVETSVANRIIGVRDILLDMGYDPDTVTTQSYIPRGSLSIETEPAGARVFINSDFAGRTPFEANRLNEGTYDIRITLDEYHPVSEEVSIQGSQHTIVRHDLQPRQRIEDYVPPNPGYLTVRAAGRGLSVYVEDRRFGFTPIENAGIAPGTYSIRVESEGWTTWESEVTIEPGEETEVLAPVRELSAASPEERAVNLRHAGNITMMSGGGIFVAGAGVGLIALMQAGRYNNNPNDPGRASSRDTAKAMALTADIMMGTGLLVAGTGAIMRFVFGKETVQTDVFDDLVFAPSAGPDHFSIQIGGSFR